MVTIRVSEMFASVQGEGGGEIIGLPMAFVRLSGCSVGSCFLHPSNRGGCDADWHRSTAMDVRHVRDWAIGNSPSGWVAVTGGEPLDQRDRTEQFVLACRTSGLKVVLYTSGKHPVGFDVDWLSVSPKMPVSECAQLEGDELKLMHWPNLELEDMRSWYVGTSYKFYFLQPIAVGGKGADGRASSDLVMMANPDCGPWRLSLQQQLYTGAR